MTARRIPDETRFPMKQGPTDRERWENGEADENEAPVPPQRSANAACQDCGRHEDDAHQPGCPMIRSDDHADFCARPKDHSGVCRDEFERTGSQREPVKSSLFAQIGAILTFARSDRKYLAILKTELSWTRKELQAALAREQELREFMSQHAFPSHEWQTFLEAFDRSCLTTIGRSNHDHDT